MAHVIISPLMHLASVFVQVHKPPLTAFKCDNQVKTVDGIGYQNCQLMESRIH